MIENEKIAEQIANWTAESKSMLAKSPEEILKHLEEGTGILVLNDAGEIAGFGAITFDWPDDWKELGAIIVDPFKREHGFGHKVVGELITAAQEMFPESKLFALCNNKSLKLFLDNGAEIITDPMILPEEVFEECIKCPNFQIAKAEGKICCDTPVIINDPEPVSMGCCR